MSSDRQCDAEALRALGDLALIQIPTRGVFAPDEDHLYGAITRIADQHLGLAKSRREFYLATKAVEGFADRDAIESAHTYVLIDSDEAYFYTGLAFGVTLAHFGGLR